MSELILHLAHGGMIVVPASLACTTTYVVLEQETWFEKEIAIIARWLKPGMTVIDIGANYGIYALPMARQVGPSGRVYAYEPGSDTRRLLERGAAENRLDNLLAIDAALSDGIRQGRLALGASSEANSLSGDGPGETVRVTSLDAEERERGWSPPDFVKIDAEGEEERILAGGREFFARHSPLVMFEIKAGRTINEALRRAFRALGFGIYRLLPGEPILVPDDPSKPVDSFELNLFAAKPDRAAQLAAEGLLVESLPDWRPDETARARAFDPLRAAAFGPVIAPLLQDSSALDADYRDGLAAYARWRDPAASLAERCAALAFAVVALQRLCRRAPNFPRLSSLARIAWEAGARDVAVAALDQFLVEIDRRPRQIAEPFWPACPRYDDLAPGGKLGDWFIAAVVEQHERIARFSSLFIGGTPRLEWLCGTEFASAEMLRRHVLWTARAGRAIHIPERLRAPAPDHLNAAPWATNSLPLTNPPSK